MADSKQIQQIVERAVAQVLDRQLPKLQAELVEHVIAELPAQPSHAGSGGAAAVPSSLVHAMASIHAGTTQKEILRSPPFRGRVREGANTGTEILRKLRKF